MTQDNGSLMIKPAVKMLQICHFRYNKVSTNDDVFRSVCSAYLKPMFVVCANMTHNPGEIETIERPLLFYHNLCHAVIL
jgi:hypothetical protein